MPLRTKIVTLLVVLFAAYAVLAYGIQYFVIFPSFHELEQEEATKNVERALGTFQRETQLLGFSVMDWARWDDSYRFMEDRNHDFQEANLNATALESLNVNLLSFYDLEGHRVWGMSHDPEAEREPDLGELSLSVLPPGHSLLVNAESTDLISGLLLTPEGPTLVVAHPVLNSQGKGPARGTIVMGRLLDEKAMSLLAAQARVNLKVKQLTGEEPLPSAPALAGKILPHSAIDLAETPEVTFGVATIFDIRGKPALMLEVNNPREITARGRKALIFATLSLGGVGGLVLIAVMVLLRRTVLEPVSRLTRHAIAVGAHDNLSSRLLLDSKDEFGILDSKDEFGILASEFNRMVERLAEARKRLLDQSYKMGVTEMAVGVLHNIGNAITPLAVKLSLLKSELQQAPVAEMELARAELADAATPGSRRADLMHYIELAGPELAALVSHTIQELDGVSNKVDYVQLILADQQRFSRAERFVEAVAFAGIVEESVRLMPEHLRRMMTIEVDTSVEQVGTVSATRIVLQQVLSNVLINAAEAIVEGGKGPDTGRVCIRASEEAVEGVSMAHLHIEDNGIGVPPDSLPHLFECGFSTKKRGSGMGLHWSANAMGALQGRLSAESEGLGRGTVLHLFLPLAELKTEPLESAA